MKSHCRICNHQTIESFLDLGVMSLTGKYAEPGIDIEKHPLNLGKCLNCGLVQLLDKFTIKDLYSVGYGYESHLNSAMKFHLQSTAKYIEKRFKLTESDIILDIASNDGTLLAGYTVNFKKLIGIDPLITVLNDKYPNKVVKINDFFTKEIYFSQISEKCKVVTSFSVFYDLENPIKFANDVENILTDDGVWILEQSYLPSMIKSLGFDTICHEHLLYLSLSDFNLIFQAAGLQIFDIKINEINGGSIQIYVKKKRNKEYGLNPYVNWLLNWEVASGITSFNNCLLFAKAVKEYSLNLKILIEAYRDSGYYIFGLGASTKGNVLLQYCNLGDLIHEIGEINPRKFGKVTPGTNIPIVNQDKLIGESGSSKINHLGIIIPWHFKSSIQKSAQSYLDRGGSLLTPLPFPEVI